MANDKNEFSKNTVNDPDRDVPDIRYSAGYPTDNSIFETKKKQIMSLFI